MGSFDDTLAVACKEGDLNKVKKLILEDDFDVNSASFRNKVGVNRVFRIFLSLRFYVKSILEILKCLKLRFLPFYELRISKIGQISAFF